MKNIVLAIALLLFSLNTFGQKTKKQIIKSEMPSYKETFYVLKSDVTIKHGTYKKERRGKVYVTGQYDNGRKVGIWEYYSANGSVAHKYNFTVNRLIFDIDKDKHKSEDTSKYSTSCFPLGGYSSLYWAIGNIMRYPGEAKRKGREGKVFIKFTIDKYGKLKNPYITKGIGDGCDEEAVRTIKIMDVEWFPALDLEGQPIESEMGFPLVFKLN